MRSRSATAEAGYGTGRMAATAAVRRVILKPSALRQTAIGWYRDLRQVVCTTIEAAGHRQLPRAIGNAWKILSSCWR